MLLLGAHAQGALDRTPPTKPTLRVTAKTTTRAARQLGLPLRRASLAGPDDRHTAKDRDELHVDGPAPRRSVLHLGRGDRRARQQVVSDLAVVAIDRDRTAPQAP